MDGNMGNEKEKDKKNDRNDSKEKDRNDSKEKDRKDSKENDRKDSKENEKEDGRENNRKDGKDDERKSGKGSRRRNRLWNAVFVVSAAVMALSVVCFLMLSIAADTDNRFDEYDLGTLLESCVVSDYTESELFYEAVAAEAGEQLRAARAKALFETNGAYDGDKTIDLAYYEGLWEDVPETGVSYRLEDLIECDPELLWRDALTQRQLDKIISIKKQNPDEHVIYADLEKDAWDENGWALRYELCLIKEPILPADGDSLYVHAGDIVTMSHYSDYLVNLIWYIHGMYSIYCSEEAGESNVGIAYVDPEQGILGCTFADYEGARQGSYEELCGELREYVMSRSGYGYAIFEGAGSRSGLPIPMWQHGDDVWQKGTLFLTVDLALDGQDALRKTADAYSALRAAVWTLIVVFGICALALVVSFLRRTVLEVREEQYKERRIRNWFTELLPVWLLGFGALIVYFGGSAELLLFEYFAGYYEYGNDAGIWLSGGALLLFGVLLALLLSANTLYFWLECVHRFHRRTLYQKSMTRWLLRMGKALLKHFWAACKRLAHTGKTCVGLMSGKARWVVGYLLFLLVNFFGLVLGFHEGLSFPIMLLVIADLAIGFALLSREKEREEIRGRMSEIAQGESCEPLEEERFHGMNRRTAQLVNDMGRGISRAVEKSLKDERMRAELITNVSHDIRTPLTSVINYVDLLKKEPAGSEKAEEYLAVLEEKAARLKQLTDDLMEASKITSGNITVVPAKLSMRELVQQMAAEYEERLAARELTLMTVMPEGSGKDFFTGDSRHVWRVLSNLLGNVCKYAMPRTRVYLNVHAAHEGRLRMELKNMSEYPLNISPEELTERFVRGDESRGTEGNGLGLSIAKSLMLAMGGTLDIAIDGDLFKVILDFPV